MTKRSQAADVVDLEDHRATLILRNEAEKIKTAGRFVFDQHDRGELSDEELVAIWGQGI